MVGGEVGPSKSRKRKESRDSREPHLSLNGHTDSTSETKTTKKKKKAVLESSLVSYLKSSSAVNENLEVVLALPLFSADTTSLNTGSLSKSNHKVDCKALSEVQNEEVQVNQRLEAAPKTVDGNIKVSTWKRTRVVKRRIDEENEPSFDNGTKKVSDLYLVDQNQEIPVNKSLEAESKTGNEHRESGTGHKQKKRTRVGKRHTDHVNKILLNGTNTMSNTLEDNHSYQNLMDQNQGVVVIKSLEDASKTVNEHDEVFPIQPKKKRTNTGKRRIAQGSKSPLEGGGDNILESCHSNQNLMDKNEEVPVNKSLEAVSNTADEYEDACTLKQLKKRTREGKRHTEKNKLSKILGSEHSDQMLDQKHEVRVKKSFEAASKKAAEYDEVCISQQRKKRKMEGKRRTNHGNEPPLENERNIHPDQKLMEENPDPLSAKILENHKETEIPSLGVKGLVTYQRKGKSICSSLDNNNEVCVSNLDWVKIKGRSKRKSKTKAVQSKQQDENLESVPKHNFSADQVQQVNVDDSSTVQKSEFFVEQKMEDSLTDCEKDSTLLEINDLKYESCSHSKEAESGPGDQAELCKEGYKTTSQNGMIFSVDEISANLPREKVASKKRHRKDKKKHISHEANASHDLSTLEQPDCSHLEGSITTFSNECQMGETAPSIGVLSNNATMVRVEFNEDKVLKRSASPERAPIGHTRKKLLILDLNGLLVDIVSDLPKGYKADKRIAQKALLKRPFCDDFLKFCFERFNVGVWSSRTKRNVDSVVDFIMRDVRHNLLFCWDQSHCTDTGFGTVEQMHKPLVLKELKKLWEKGEYNESNTLLLDDSPYKALLNPRHTAIFPYSYDFRNANDNSLGPGGDLRMYLEGLATAENVQKYIEQNPFGQRAITCKNPSWLYYLRVIKANNFCVPT